MADRPDEGPIQPAPARDSKPEWSAETLRSARKKLLNWSEKFPRPMPWRGVRDPYRVWISEIMLQQTTVTAVIPYYERFLTKFPDVQSLAAAEESHVLSAWEGLGYYSRGRNLHRAARVVVGQHQGRFPATVSELVALPGIGRYTAGAIASFAFDEPAPILEVNTHRLYLRLLGEERDPRSKPVLDRLWRFAESLVPKTGAGRVNQALIDLGSTICTPTDPQCPACPLNRFCNAFQLGAQNRIPPPKVRAKVTPLYEAAIAIRDGNQWLVRQREATERWAGMWDFPRIALPSPMKANDDGRVLQQFAEAWGLKTSPIARFTDFHHSVTRYRVQLARIVAQRTGGQIKRTGTHRWVEFDELENLPMPMAARRFVRELAKGNWNPSAPKGQ